MHQVKFRNLIFGFILTATTFFLIGAFCQHLSNVSNLRGIIRSNPYAYYIRDKLYAAFNVLHHDYEMYKMYSEASRMEEIMKYGFPGLDDIRVYADFVLSYDRRNRVAHWVCEHLHSNCVTDPATAPSNVSRRAAHYQADMEVPSNFRAEPADYKRTGFDRGHLAAAANHRGHQSHCNETFYLTNIAPQVGRGFNRDAWNNLECYVRDLAKFYGSVYVCTGPLYLPKRQPSGRLAIEYEVIGRNTVAVPTHFFKVITVESKLPSGKPYMEAYLMPNRPIDSDVDIRSFLCDIRQIERSAGLQFFNGLRRSFFFDTNYPNAADVYERFQ